MAKQNSKPDMPDHADELDRILNAGLANYAAHEPRWGLEQRLLASLQAERSRIADHLETRWTIRWSWMAFFAAMLLVALTVASRYGETFRSTSVKHLSAAAQAARNPEATAPSSRNVGPITGQHSTAIRRAAMRHSPTNTMAAVVPKLERFPSTQPLSEQEKLLQSYVAEDPRRAVLLARAKSEALRRDALEEQNAFPSGTDGPDSGTIDK